MLILGIDTATPQVSVAVGGRPALLSHDDTGFRTDVTAASAWVKQYFDTRTKSVQALASTLTQLAATPMPTGLPDLAARLTALPTVKATRGRTGSDD